MQPSPNTGCNSLPFEGGRRSDGRRPDDLVYPLVTLAAMVLLLASLWVF